MKYVIKPDATLTEAAKNVFGDIVDCAYMAALFFAKGRPAKSEFEKIKQYRGEVDYIRNDHIGIVIEFSNGKSVLLTNSEWGSIRDASSDVYKPGKR